MNINRIFAVVLRQYYLLRSSFTRVLPLFVWVGIDIVLWGFLTKYLNSLSAHLPDFVPSLLGAVLFWNFLIRVMQGVTLAFFEDVWSRNFLNMFATPMKTSDYVSGLVLSSIGTSAVGLLAMLFLSSSLFGFSFFAYGVMAFPYLLMLFLFGIALGILGCAVVMRFGPAAEWFIWPIPAFIAPFTGVFYPLSTLPPWLQDFGLIFPPSYIFESMRALASGGAVSLSDLVIGFALSLFYIGLAYLVFAWVYRHAMRSGLIARYSAENV